MKSMIRKCRQRLRSANLGNDITLFKRIREFYENDDSNIPFNYLISVTYDAQDAHKDPNLREKVLSICDKLNLTELSKAKLF